jgi:hypothetical protein
VIGAPDQEDVDGAPRNQAVQLRTAKARIAENLVSPVPNAEGISVHPPWER